jgi:hypothetical protein
MFAFACSALSFETLAYLSDLSNIERVIRLTAENLHYADASLTRRRRHIAFEILWQRSFVDYFIHWIIFRFQMHDAFQNHRFFWIKTSFIEKQKDDVDDVISSSLKIYWASTSSSLNVVCWIFLKLIEAESISCVICSKFYLFQLFWLCIAMIKSNDCFHN